MPYRVIHSQLVCADYDRTYPMIVRGEGAELIDAAGKRYIDGSGCTAAVSSLGHGVPEIVEAMQRQASMLTVHPAHLFHNEEIERYFERLVAFAPEGFAKAWTISGGTEAVENAIKLAYQYHRAKGNTKRSRVLGRWGSYHGNSILALDVGGMVVRREFYTPLMSPHNLHLSPCFPYRKPDGLSLQAYEDSLVQELEETIERHPDEIVAWVAEPIVGAALAAVAPTEHYFERMAAVCRKHDIVLIADEVMTGFGRTGTNFGCDHYGAHADILACAKGISGGYLPMGAIIARNEILEPLEASGDPFFSGQTYTCTPLAAAVGNAALDYIETQDLVARSKGVGTHLKRGLGTLLDLEHVGDVRGEGLFLGVEFVADKASKAPLPAERGFAKRVEAHCLERGLIAYAGRGTVEFTRGDHMLFAPPLVLSDDQADRIVEILRDSIVAASSER